MEKKGNDKKSYPERLHDVFIQHGYCEPGEFTAFETGVALLIDEIIMEVREEPKRQKLEKCTEELSGGEG